MKRISGWITLALLVAAGLSAQTPQALLDTPEARVVLITVPPHQRNSPQEHWTNRVLIYRDAGHMTLSEPDGRIEDIEFSAGDVRWSSAGSPYIAENLTDHPIRIVAIEIKRKPAGAAPASKLDPVIVDSRHYKNEFENEQVRILRVHYNAHEQGVLHEHILNRVVFYINDQANQKAGDVRIAGAATHTEENKGDSPADRIAVELK